MLVLSRTRILRSLLLCGLGAVAACSSSSDGDGNVGTTSATESLTAVPAVTPSWANKANFVGRLDAGTAVSLQVHLQMHDFAGAQATLAAISDPDNALYGQFLSDEDFAAKYAPTSDDVNAVSAHLAKSGLRVTYTPENNAFLTVEGTSAQVEQAFATRLGQYKVEGAMMRATMDTPKLPA
jgi:subtilase family serine protease